MSLAMQSRAALDSKCEVIVKLVALGLTTRQAEVTALLTTGLENKDIAEKLFISESTANWHMSRVLKKLGVKYRHLAILKLKRMGVLG
jgi:DNA-binding NarL/FixJ family response regulator